ncbi:hypothetical protein IEO21_05658 [Rhodonia placenta]|uniref:Uncharacterized protein n=1 Tax=Rhodonia placenta TaxID=104341 RepID=A0A8H7U1W4_9APHY|nr:hypothetical protein IEO21_05658 [Postia placenta]
MKTKNSFKLEMLAHNTAHPAVKNAHRGPLTGEWKMNTHHFARCAVIKLESVASNDCASKIIHRAPSRIDLRTLAPALCPFGAFRHGEGMIDIQDAIGSGESVGSI